jgi:hypothetical protein
MLKSVVDFASLLLAGAACYAAVGVITRFLVR